MDTPLIAKTCISDIKAINYYFVFLFFKLHKQFGTLYLSLAQKWQEVQSETKRLQLTFYLSEKNSYNL